MRFTNRFEILDTLKALQSLNWSANLFFEVIEIVANSFETISLARIVLQRLKSVWQVENVLLSVIQNIFIDTLRKTATIVYEC